MVVSYVWKNHTLARSFNFSAKYYLYLRLARERYTNGIGVARQC